MSFKKILLLFLISLPVCVAARIFGIVYATEYETGFSVSGREVINYAVIALIAVVCVALAFFSFKAYKNPEKPPRTKALLSVLAMVVVCGLLREVIFENMPQTMLAWQVLLLKFTTVICAIYFVVFAVQGMVGFKLPALLHAIPCIYAIIKTIFTFINISSLALISDNILLVASYCLLMFFFINYGKLYNGLGKEKGFRKLAATGLPAATLCITQSLSVILVNAFSVKPYLHSDSGVMWAIFGIGLFIIGFLYEYFYKVETKKEHI